MELTLTKSITKNFQLQPYGKFVIKLTSRGRNKLSPNVIVFYELQIHHHTAMPLSDENEKKIVKMMKQNHTDFLTDGQYYYTRLNAGLVEVSHPKLIKYRTDEQFKLAVDSGHSFEKKTL